MIRRFYTPILILLVLCGCEIALADCWPDLADAHASFAHEFEFSKDEFEKIQSARVAMQARIYECTQEDEFVAPPSIVKVGYELSLSFLEVAIMSDDASLTRTMANRWLLETSTGNQALGWVERKQMLHMGAYFEAQNAARELLALGDDPNVQDEDGLTPLHSATVVSPAGLSLIRELVSYGANVNALSTRGITPIMYARSSGELGKAQCLYALGAAIPKRTEYEGATHDLYVAESLVAAVDSFFDSTEKTVPAIVAKTCTLKAQ